MTDGKLLGHTDVVQYLILYGVILQKRSDFDHLRSFILPAHTDVSGKSTRLLKQHGTDAERKVGFCKLNAGTNNVIAVVSLLAGFNGHSLISKEVYFTFFMKQGRDKDTNSVEMGKLLGFFFLMIQMQVWMQEILQCYLYQLLYLSQAYVMGDTCRISFYQKKVEWMFIISV